MEQQGMGANTVLRFGRTRDRVPAGLQWREKPSGRVTRVPIPPWKALEAVWAAGSDASNMGLQYWVFYHFLPLSEKV